MTKKFIFEMTVLGARTPGAVFVFLAEDMSHSPDYCETSPLERVENSLELLLYFPGLSKTTNCCTISSQKGHRPKGGVIMAEMTKQAEGKEEMLRLGVHKKMIEEILTLSEDEANEVTHLLASLQIVQCQG